MDSFGAVGMDWVFSGTGTLVWSCAKIRRRNEFSAGNEVKITSCHGVVATLKEVGMPMPYLF